MKLSTVDRVLTYQLFGLNEVQHALQFSKLKVAPGMLTPSTNSGSLVTIDLERTKVRDILSRIATDSGFKFWTFQLSGARREFLSISMSDIFSLSLRGFKVPQNLQGSRILNARQAKAYRTSTHGRLQ